VQIFKIKGKNMRVLVIAGLLLFSSTSVFAQEKLQIIEPGAKTVGDPVGYAFGYQFGSNLAQGGIEAGDIKQDDLIKGIMDALAGKEPGVANETVQAAMKTFEEKLIARAQEKAKAKLVDEAKFLEENKKKEGIQVTQTGLQYKVIKSGDGASPKQNSNVTVHYEGKLVNGKIFDSSLKRGQPASFNVGQVIPGWTEALLRMKVGDKWQLFIPSGLAYKDNPPPQSPIGPNDTLIFEVELLEVK
jgi:FKBP-type peptidyl-prolyl cis-trans isomerase FklB